jgi:hypothetical protein
MKEVEAEMRMMGVRRCMRGLSRIGGHGDKEIRRHTRARMTDGAVGTTDNR